MRRVMVTMVMMTLLMTTVMTATEEFNAIAVIRWIIDTWSDSRCGIDNFINFVPLDSYFKQVLFFSPVISSIIIVRFLSHSRPKRFSEIDGHMYPESTRLK